MLDTLYEFGRQVSQGADRAEFDDLIAVPPIDENDIKKNVQFHVANIIFDLDDESLRLDVSTKLFSSLDKSYAYSPYALRCLKIQGGNNKSIYPTVDPRKSFLPWKKTLFGKDGSNGSSAKVAELVESVQKDFPDLAERQLCKAVARIFPLRILFEELYPDVKALSAALGMDEKNKLVMLFASVVSTELGILEPTPIVHLDGFDDFLRRKMQKTSVANNEEDSKSLLKTCYVTGESRNDVGEPVFNNRYSLNKMFVTTTKNYAAGFDDSNFAKNYQASAEAQVFLERGSAYLIKHYKVQIAGVDHCILPKFRTSGSTDLLMSMTRLKNRSELLFSMSKNQLKGLINDMESLADEDIYWITFLGFESDGNFFKTINIIEDVSKTHFERLIKTLYSVEIEMAEIEGVQWESVMAYGKEQFHSDFNFYTIYNLIPVREEKEKRNEALILFKAILERRPISRAVIMKHFVQLIKCHRFGRYTGSNIYENTNFDFATRNAVFQFQAFIQFLKKIKLLDMAETTDTTSITHEEKNAAITAFFERMGYNTDQKALFFLGMILNNVGFAQVKKEHKTKPILGKLNYNGMNAQAIKRLRIDLFEKCKQYDILKYNEGNFSKFTDLFKDAAEDQWDRRMKPAEALFYLLSGYSFRTSKEVSDVNPDVETDSEN